MVLDNKVAIITGANKGIGAAIAHRLARAGAYTVLLDVGSADDAAERIRVDGGRASALQVDVTDPEHVEREFARVASELGSIDVLVNNAGIIARGTIRTITYDMWRQVIDVNLNGTFNCCKAAAEHMIRAGGGKILNIASVAGKMGDVTAAPAYGASKGGVITLTRSLARQLADHNITVNGIAPHAVETDMSAEWSTEKRRAVIEAIPLKRLASPAEIAEAALFLVSQEADFITGEVLNMNGGFLMD